MTRKGISGILVTLILFTGLIGVVSVPGVTEIIPTTEVFYGDARQVFEQGLYVIATETNPVEMSSNYTNRKAYYEMLRDHVTTVASTGQFVSILISRGVCPSSGYSVGIESIWKINNEFVLSAKFTEPGGDCLVLMVITNPVALIPIGNLSVGEYSIALSIDWYEFICSVQWYRYLQTDTWTESFDVLLTTPDLGIEGIVLPYFGAVPLIYPTPDPAFFYNINATVTNLGTSDAGSFKVSFSVHLNETEVPEYGRKKTISGLAQGVNETVWFDFSPEDYGNYTLVIEADCDNDVAELDETNNTKTTWVIGAPRGDMDGDGDVDKYDFGWFAMYYGKRFTKPPYPPADFDYDGNIDKYDFGTFAGNYGQSLVRACSTEWITVTGSRVEMSIENKTTPLGEEISILMVAPEGGWSQTSQIFDVYLYDSEHNLFSFWSYDKYFLHVLTSVPSGYNQTLRWNLYRYDPATDEYTPPPLGNYYLVGVLANARSVADMTSELLITITESTIIPQGADTTARAVP